MADKRSKTMKEKYVKPIDNSEDAYARLKPITDAAQAGALKPWSASVIDLLARYDVNVQRLEDVKAQVNLSFPTSIKDHRSMAIGFRYAKDDGSFAEDLFVFIEDVGLTCYYRGSQEEALPEYSGSHHAEMNSLHISHPPQTDQQATEVNNRLEHASFSFVPVA